jgi:hypothetical protein
VASAWAFRSATFGVVHAKSRPVSKTQPAPTSKILFISFTSSAHFFGQLSNFF